MVRIKKCKQILFRKYAILNRKQLYTEDPYTGFHFSFIFINLIKYKTKASCI